MAWGEGFDLYEPGKDADIVIWDGDPFNFYTSAATVLIEGNVVYQKQQ